MGILQRLDIGDSILYSSNYFSGNYNHDLYIKRVISNEGEKPKYYINLFTKINGEWIRQGYLYFYLDHDYKISEFIGVNVRNEYRNLNIGSFLIASWIDLCLNEGYDFLGANKKQKKPFLLYLLKKYGFDIFDKSLYLSRNDVITICKSKSDDKAKFLLFKDKDYEKRFILTNVFKEDNYKAVENKNEVVLLDDVIVTLQDHTRQNFQYFLINYDACKKKTEGTLSNHKK